jgi:hypothetical protein
MATTLTFNDLAPGGIGNTYEDNGFVLTGTPRYNDPYFPPQFYAGNQTSPDGSVSIGLGYYQVGGGIDLHAADNRLFDAISIDISNSDGNRMSVPVDFAGIKGDGKVVYATYWLPLPAERNDTFVFGEEFRDIKALRWSQGAIFHKFDNIVLSETAVVPEPSSIALLTVALTGLALTRRRKRS